MASDPQAELAPEGPWELPVANFEVIHLTFSFHVDITAYGSRPESSTNAGAPSVLVRLTGSFDLQQADGTVAVLDPSRQEWDDLRPLFALRGDRIASAHAKDGGLLSLRFSSGRQIVAGPDPDYENWEVVGPGFLLVAMPGGGTAVFNDRRS